MENVDTAAYFTHFRYLNLSIIVVIDSLKLIFPCDVFVGVSDGIQYHFFGRENDGD